jgi:hypothetical protein
VPGLVLGGVITFVVSLMLACVLLRWRCRKVGPPFGRRARYWAFFIVVATASASAIVGVLFLAAGRVPAYVGILVPGGLWLSKLPPQRDRDMLPRTWPALLTLPFSRLYDRMGDDMQEWCDTRIEAARFKPQWIADAAQYYWNQMGRVTDPRARADLDRWLQSITHKIATVNLTDLEPGPRRIRAALQQHSSTRDSRRYSEDDPVRTARRLETEALNELHLFLAYAYRLGYHTMLIYPYRPSAHRFAVRPAQPITPDL